MGKLKSLAFAGLFGVSLTYAGGLEELKKLFEQKDVEINIAVTGDYLYTSNRDDNIDGENGYEDRFGYSGFIGLYKEAKNNSPYGFGFSFGQAWFPVVGVEPLPKPDDANGAFSDSDSNFGIFEAYAEGKFGPVKVKAGRFATMIGGEAPFTWQNVNIQRGLVWNGEPVFFDGVRVSADLGRFSFYAGVNDRDTDDGKMALEAGVGTSIGKIDAGFNILIPDKKDSSNTRVYNLTLNINYWDFLPLTFYVDYLNTPKEGDDIDSWGAALLGEFKFNNAVSVGGRVEYVNNDGDGDNYGIGEGNSAWTFTLTPKYQINKYLYVRAEVSYVKLENDYYRKHNDKPNDLTDNEFRAGMELAFVF